MNQPLPSDGEIQSLSNLVREGGAAQTLDSLAAILDAARLVAALFRELQSVRTELRNALSAHELHGPAAASDKQELVLARAEIVALKAALRKAA